MKKYKPSQQTLLRGWTKQGRCRKKRRTWTGSCLSLSLCVGPLKYNTFELRVSSASSECNERFRRIGKCWRPYSRIRTISILPGKGDKYKRLKALVRSL